jgi:3-oxoacyl-[acyl-carrier-protein] synthase II
MAYRRGESQSETHRVVVTGAGIITAMGCGWEVNAEGFRSGRVALGPVTVFDTTRQRVHRGGEAIFPGQLPETNITPRQSARLDRATRLLLCAGDEAFRQAGWDEAMKVDSMPLSLGTSAGAMSLGEAYFKSKTFHSGRTHGTATLAHCYQPQTQARVFADAFGIHGPVTIIANACASGANAIGHAFHLVKHGRARRAVCGGYDAIAEMVFAGFDSLQALSTSTPRPFDAARDGLALGEGAAILTLERLEDALARDATILAEITGYGASTDLHHLTQPHPEGEAAMRSMTAACDEAGVTPAQIQYINAHGTGTPLNDSSEANAIHRWAGDAAAAIKVSSTKGSIGHLLGGAGAVEAVICLMALRGGWVPPNVPVSVPDAAVTFDLVTQPRDIVLEHVLTNSFGFGGANATLAMCRFS